ncbi:hypothetical protein QTJ16_001505 [Diplocarpon rosae]|uniref:MARVEL domain-containing protein n=1 Tax=Diplocarpon rosae TaxID=946125 RepID=A0AAD9T492_9HELO|nr:hypothetical protein QTJ16_001505 [Diplocarpon rosae]PBP18268.1 chaperone-binding protein [Diplocarpon rosae]
MVEFDVHNLQKIKMILHITAMVFIVVSAIMQIVVMIKADSIDGRPGWYFGLCFLTIPAVIYLTMTPRFPRTRKLANPYAMALVDVLFCILWISAFASQASYNSSGKCNGACGASKAVVAFGVFIWLFWCCTAFMSLYGVVYYRREGYLPGASRAPFNAQAIDPDKEAFSTAPHDDEYAPVHNTDHHEEPDQELHDNSPSHYAGGSSATMHSRYNADSFGGGYIPPSVHEEPTGYAGYSGAAPVQEHEGRVQFPDARYSNVGGVLDDGR